MCMARTPIPNTHPEPRRNRCTRRIPKFGAPSISRSISIGPANLGHSVQVCIPLQIVKAWACLGAINHVANTARCGRDGMVDIPDLKSVGPSARVGSSPTARTKPVHTMIGRSRKILDIKTFDTSAPMPPASASEILLDKQRAGNWTMDLPDPDPRAKRRAVKTDLCKGT